MKQSLNASTRLAGACFWKQTFSAFSLAIAPPVDRKQCASRLALDASARSVSAKVNASVLDCRLPCLGVSSMAPSSAASINSGSECPKKWTPIPQIMSHFTDPSASSTSAPLPTPEPI